MKRTFLLLSVASLSLSVRAYALFGKKEKPIEDPLAKCIASVFGPYTWTDDPPRYKRDKLVLEATRQELLLDRGPGRPKTPRQPHELTDTARGNELQRYAYDLVSMRDQMQNMADVFFQPDSGYPFMFFRDPQSPDLYYFIFDGRIYKVPFGVPSSNLQSMHVNSGSRGLLVEYGTFASLPTTRLRITVDVPGKFSKKEWPNMADALELGSEERRAVVDKLLRPVVLARVGGLMDFYLRNHPDDERYANLYRRLLSPCLDVDGLTKQAVLPEYERFRAEVSRLNGGGTSGDGFSH
ncbi:MAG: hypothetical protein JST16_15470 [Bdellovibrionales bacterium]|nr:hypothetical protein [Bdellovibrionales bacterium]